MAHTPSGRFEVRVSPLAAEKAACWGWQRGSDGTPSEGDLWSGPLGAAILRFGAFEDCDE